MDGVLVHAFIGGKTRLHHHTTSDSVEGVRDDARDSGHALSNQPGDDERSGLWIRKHALGSIEKAKVCGTVDDDTY